MEWTAAEKELVQKAEKKLKSQGIEFFSIGPSNRKDKKLKLGYIVGNDLKEVHFGAKNSQTFLEGASDKKRAAYIARHSKILLKNGSRAVDQKFSPSWLAMKVLW